MRRLAVVIQAKSLPRPAPERRGTPLGNTQGSLTPALLDSSFRWSDRSWVANAQGCFTCPLLDSSCCWNDGGGR